MSVGIKNKINKEKVPHEKLGLILVSLGYLLLLFSLTILLFGLTHNSTLIIDSAFSAIISFIPMTIGLGMFSLTNDSNV